METSRTRETVLACRLPSSGPAGSALPEPAGKPWGLGGGGRGGRPEAQAKGKYLRMCRWSLFPHSLRPLAPHPHPRQSSSSDLWSTALACYRDLAFQTECQDTCSDNQTADGKASLSQTSGICGHRRTRPLMPSTLCNLWGNLLKKIP